MRVKSPRIAVRAVIVHDERVLLVNAWPGASSTLLCAPGGGVETGTSLMENLRREVLEETGLEVEVGAPCLVNEFHDPKTGFHQVDVFFRCFLINGAEIEADWQDPEEVVNRHVWARQEDFTALRVKPDALQNVAFGDASAFTYDPLEEIVS